MQLSSDEKQKIRLLILPFIKDLHRFAINLTGNTNSAEDLVAETVTLACERFRQLRDHDKVKQWLLRILSNRFIDNTRARKHYSEISIDEFEDEDFSLFEKVSIPFLLWKQNPEQELLNKILDEDISSAIAKLPEQFRVAIILCDVEGFTYKEIAVILNIPVGTVRSRIARGRSILQKQLWHYAKDAGIINSSFNRQEQKI